MADPYIANVSLLLHCDGVNGSATFTDSSPLTLTMTAGGGLISTTQSKFGGASAYFNGTSRVEAPSSSVFAVGTGDYTIEFFGYFSTTTIRYLLSTVYTPGVYFYLSYETGTLTLVTSAASSIPASVPVDTWTHVAIVRSSGIASLYINGVSAGTATINNTYGSYGSGPFYIGGTDSNMSSSNQWGLCYIDEFRITKGVARYTTAFTPPTAAFDNSMPSAPSVADPYYNSVSLLLHCDGVNGSTTFTDNSPNPKTISVVGSTAISTAQSKFGGASTRFDGTASQLATSTSTDLAFGTGDFTIECFININAYKNYGFIYLTTGATTHFLLALGSTGRTLRAFVTGSVIDLNGPTTLALNTWYHVAVTRSGTTVRLFLNGVLEVSGTCASTFTDTSAIIGEAADPIDAYIDELRVTTGAARYTANFTPPIAAFGDSWAPPEAFKKINTALGKSAFQWITLPKYYRYVPAALGKAVVNYSGSPKRYTTIYTYKARNDFNNAYFGGVGTVSGTVKIGTNVAKRRVRLYENSTGILIREIWSAEDGTYTFIGLNKNYVYTVTSTDIDNVYNDVVFANITAV